MPPLPGGLLPTFVLDRYEGLEPRLLQDFTPAERDAYVAANAAALRELQPADLVFANHVLLGAPVGRASGAPFRVKAHGSELEYSMRGRPELERFGRESLAAADATYVGSEHIRRVLSEVVGHVEPVVTVPPGVDVDRFTLQERSAPFADLLREASADPPNPGNAEERLPDEGNAKRLESFLARDEPTVVYFGKLIEQKGVQILLEAMRQVDARLVVVGFGPVPPRCSRPPRRRRARSSRGRSSTAISSTCCRSPTRRRAVDLPGGVRHGRRRGGGRRLPAARRAPLGPGRGRRRSRGRVPRRLGRLAAFDSGDVETCGRS